ncbi:MAG: putative Ig domain-containing protein, partial [Acidobacteriota bacterium]
MKRVLKNTPTKLFILFALILICSQTSFATTVVIPTDDAMVLGSRAIVRARVLAVGTSYDEQTNRVYSYITLRIQEVLKGKIKERKIVLKELGGETPTMGTLVYGNPRYRPEQNVIVFLDTWRDGSYRTHQMYLGKYNIEMDEQTGHEMAVRETVDEGVVVLQNIADAENPQKTDRVELSSFLQMIREKVVAQTEQSRIFEETYYSGVPRLAEPPEYQNITSEGRIQPNWTYISSAHPSWFEIYDGQPVSFLINPTGAPTSSSVNDVESAMNAWSVISGSALRVVNGGTTGNCTSGFQNVIVFNNCDGRWSPSGGSCQGTLALGGLNWIPGSTRVINGVTFVQATGGFISFNPYAACYSGDHCNLQEIATHELGHALGLGHSSVFSATMYAIAHFDGRCASVMQDDMDAMRFIYPATSGGGGPLSIVTTSPLANATTGQAYSQTLVASGGTAPYTWSLVSGSLPAGLTLSSSGVISGTPTTAGTANFTVQVGDSGQATAQKAFAITVSAASTAYDAQFVSQTVPTTLTPGQQFSVNMKFLNTGSQTWASGSTSFYLASQNPALNQTWGGNGVSLANFVVNPGEQLDVTFTATAPATAGTYNFQWQMYQNGGVGFFGQASTNVSIQVGSGGGGGGGGTDSAAFVTQSVATTMTAGQS